MVNHKQINSLVRGKGARRKGDLVELGKHSIRRLIRTSQPKKWLLKITFEERDGVSDGAGDLGLNIRISL